MLRRASLAMTWSSLASMGALIFTACTGGFGGSDRFGTVGSSTSGADTVVVPHLPHAAVCRGPNLRCYAQVRTLQNGRIQRFATTAGFGPSDLASAYQLNTSLNPGATIAIVDAFGYSNAESDLATYRSNYGLPPCTVASGCLTIVNQNGQASPLPPDPSAADDWTVETALDLDMASAACPNCKLVLVQAQDDQSDGLYIAQQAAASLGATVVSNSWGGPDNGTDSQYEQYFNHPNVGEFVASGDNGYDDGNQGPDYPSTSAFVTAVGGTSLVQSAGSSRGWSETAWSSGGSSCSTEIPKPAFQQGINTACSFRAASDVAAVADPNTGVAVYNNGPSSSGWIVVGGTSAASPFTAGALALTGHGTAGPGFSYANTSDFYAVTSGSNGSCGNVLCNAGPGWNGPTGNGTPNGSALSGPCTPNCAGLQCGSDGCGGSCGTCASGQTCSNGVCTAACPTGQTQCNGSCVDTSTDPNNCGACGNVCASGQTCSGGTCSGGGCPVGQTLCGGTCTDTSSDPNNCGACGNVCASGQTCSGGTCAGGGGSCAHPICTAGAALTSSCDPCAGSVCSADPYCCSVAWDSICVGEVGTICGQSCSGGGGTGSVTVAIVSPPDQAVYNSGDSFQIVVQASSSGGAITSATLSWTSPSGTSTFAMTQDVQGNWVIGGTLGVQGSRTYSVTANDSAGDSGTSATQTLYVQ